MAYYESKYAVCPFYRRNETNRIVCEGVDETNTINLVFTSRSEWREYEKTYCNIMGNYKNCLICQMLTAKEEE